MSDIAITESSEIKVFYATTQVFTFAVPTGVNASTVFKLVIKEKCDPSLNSMGDATGTVSNGVVTFSVDTLNTTFRDVSLKQEDAWLEVYADGVVFIQRQIKIACRAAGSQPPEPATLYYTKTEVDALLAAKFTLPSGGTAGQALVMTEGGTVGWKTVGGTVSSATIAEVQGGHNYRFGELASLVIGSIEHSALEANIFFTSGATATVLTLPQIFWTNGSSPQINPNCKYCISICRSLGVYGEFKDA